ncbi:MAG: aminomethyltransferase family protein, partial [Candidatus Acidiferrum sp.]
MPVGTAFHERTLALCESLNFKEWSGYYTVGAYEMTHEHEYNAIRNSSGLIDITPLFKYYISGRDATKLVNRVISRDIHKVAVDQVIYCCWCDPEGKVIDDGTITRLGEQEYRWTAADPSLRWFRQNALGLDVEIEDISEKVAALALQGPTSGKLLHAVADASIAALKYFRVTHGKIGGVPVDISRTGYTGDLGYEIWVNWKDAVKVFDELMVKGRPFDIHPAGMVALDIARIEAGLILIEVDYISSKRAIIDQQKYSPGEIGLAKLVDLKKETFVGRDALAQEAKGGGPERSLVGLEINWSEVEALYEKIGMAPQVSSTASRVAVPVYRGGRQVGKATSTTWSPTLKRMIALASISRESATLGATLSMELTVVAVRKTVSAKIVPLPIFNPPRKTTPLAHRVEADHESVYTCPCHSRKIRHSERSEESLFL